MGSRPFKFEPGQRFGRWTVVGTPIAAPAGSHREVPCRCDCGKRLNVRATRLARGLSQSCGCQPHSRVAVFHGHSRRGAPSGTYRSWQAMKNRCLNPRSPDWGNYGGRGITVCDRWGGPDGFARFLADMGGRPSGRTLDRIDPDGDYEPANCRWSTPTEQARNRRPRQPLGGRHVKQ